MDGRCDGPGAANDTGFMVQRTNIEGLDMTFSFTKWVDQVANTVATSAMIAILPVAAVMLLAHPF
jgi:hypothetical protein